MYLGFYLNNSFTYVTYLQPFLGTGWSYLLGVYATMVLASAIWEGNSYCRYVCPYGNVQRLLMRIMPFRGRLPVSNRVLGGVRWAITLALFIGIVSGLRDWGSYELFPDLFGIEILHSPWFWLSLAVVLISAYYPMLWCRMLCPTGAVLDGVAFLARPGSGEPTRRDDPCGHTDHNRAGPCLNAACNEDKEKLMLKSLMTLSARDRQRFAFRMSAKGRGTGGNRRQGATKIGVLLVNHGSRQKAWRDMLIDVENNVAAGCWRCQTSRRCVPRSTSTTSPRLRPDEGLRQRGLRRGDRATDVPDSRWPHGVGHPESRRAQERPEGARGSCRRMACPVYRPRARVTLLETIDSTDFLKANILRRTKSLLKDGDGTKYGVTLAAYGDDQFNQQWEALMGDIGKHLKDNLGIDKINYAWSGHLVNYSIDPTRKAVNQILAKKKKDIVISVYVAYDQKFQKEVIGGASPRPIARRTCSTTSRRRSCPTRT